MAGSPPFDLLTGSKLPHRVEHVWHARVLRPEPHESVVVLSAEQDRCGSAELISRRHRRSARRRTTRRPPSAHPRSSSSYPSSSRSPIDLLSSFRALQRRLEIRFIESLYRVAWSVSDVALKREAFKERSRAQGSADRRSHAVSAQGSSVYEQYRPVRIVDDRWCQSEGLARARFAIAARIALVTLSRARSACEAARRSRPPRPTALAPSEPSTSAGPALKPKSCEGEQDSTGHEPRLVQERHETFCRGEVVECSMIQC
jgi:hypothetical protein